MLQMVLKNFNFWKYHDIFGLKKYRISSKCFKFSSLQQFYCLILPKFCMQICSLCWKLILYLLNCFESFYFILIFGLIKNSKNMSVHTKMVIFTKAIARFVFNFIYWLVNPIGTCCHCGNTGSGAEFQPEGCGGPSPT